MADRIRLFDTFQFSEPHETEVLLAKLHVESDLIEKWIIVENDYAMKGGWKGRFLHDILETDRRFDPFRSRIVTVSLSADFATAYRYPLQERVKYVGKRALPRYDSVTARSFFEELRYYHAERQQRDSALDALRELSGGDGWVIVTDVDEMLDASTPSRRDAIVQAMRSGAAVLRFPRRRFNYDLDNSCAAVRFVGCASIRYLFERGVGIEGIRLKYDGLVPTADPLVYEYSYCYPRDAIARKMATFLHVDAGAERLARALECNHAILETVPWRIEPDHWYETIPLDRTGAPQYVLDHAGSLRTGNVNPEYREARARTYPELFGWR